MAVSLEDIDRRILRLLQTDGRHNTNAAISDRVGVSPSTVGKRIARLEETGVITGYRSEVDYERAGYPLEMLITCTVGIADRECLVEQALDIDGVVSVRELMTGSENVHVLVVGTSKSDITRIAHRLDALNFDVTDETLLRSEFFGPVGDGGRWTDSEAGTPE
ncbi:Lrp/AsnC family transcriptional regulator [Haloarcula marina]|uniref:Lrp/AsnC family transcriptional regulator n=1 Tax=Haloarcula marina TaxID=2961574 RepID=UPI0020B8C61C|nr:winged helix-turn-helix transcriptional regulator [Halomicroarcula marina]